MHKYLSVLIPLEWSIVWILSSQPWKQARGLDVPNLFTIIYDILSRIIARTQSEGKLNGVKVSRQSPRVIHLMYADDLVIYCKTTTQEAAVVTSCLQTYCEWSGQEINWHKSVVHYSKNVSQQLRRDIGNTLGIQECNHKGSYLGHPFCKFSSKKEAYRGQWKSWETRWPNGNREHFQ